MTQASISLNPLPKPYIIKLNPGVFLLPVLSRQGTGPGMIVIVPDDPSDQLTQFNNIPSPSLKWAEEGCNVVEVQESAIDRGYALDQAMRTFAQQDRCTPCAVGLIGRRIILFRIHSMHTC